MPKLVNSPPKYRLHRSSGRAFVVLDARRVYLGHHGTAESRRQYDATVARWLVQGRRLLPAGTAPAAFTVAELAAEFWRFAETHFRHPDGTPTGLFGGGTLSRFPPGSYRGGIAASSIGTCWPCSKWTSRTRRGSGRGSSRLPAAYCARSFDNWRCTFGSSAPLTR